MTDEDGWRPDETSPAGDPARDLVSQDPLLKRADRAIEQSQRLKAESRRSLAAAYATSARMAAATALLREILTVARQRRPAWHSPPDDGMPAR